ncbi:putative gamma-glutamylcyclotransferase CG2811 [Aplysia californica]|uniref:Gamma-glutamylcyclotransferase family protein n=1 Tax=Aplysia californica TaxID=6500 RepID=A0ABM0K2M8_APLCA|nr:putative gamma-glutamylcyclotransferase CG2811 [Aplysia californica]
MTTRPESDASAGESSANLTENPTPDHALDPNTHPHLAFVYGTLKTTEPNHRHMFAKGAAGSQLVGRARTVEKFPLIVATPYNVPFLLLKEGTGNQITGELYRVNDETLAYLDWFEDHPAWYLRTKCQVTLLDEVKAEPVECWIYGLPKFKKSLLDLPFLEVYHDNLREEHERFRHVDDRAIDQIKQTLCDRE